MASMVTISDNKLVRMIGPDTPLRLKDAVAIAFPAGGMTVAGLRKEILRGRLQAEKIANKVFVTLAGIERMRELCRMVTAPSDKPAEISHDRKRLGQPSSAEILRDRLQLVGKKDAA